MCSMRKKLCLVLLVVLGFSLGVSEFVPIGIESELSEAFGVTLADVGQCISLFSIAYAFMTPVLALSTGRFKRYTLLVAYSAIFVGGNLISFLAPSYEVLLVARVVIGAVSGALLAVGVTFLPELVEKKSVSIAIAVVYGAFSVALILTTSLAKIIADTWDWHIAMLAALIMAAVTCAALLLVVPREGATDEPATFSEQAGLLKEPQVLCGMTIFIFGVGSVYVFYAYVTPYFENVLGMDTATTSMMLMIYGMMALISNVVAGICDARFGLKTLLVLFPLQALVLASISLAGSAMPAAIIAIMALGLVMYILSVPVISMFMETAAKRHSKALTLASSLEPMSFNVGIAFGTWLGGLVVTGPGMAFSGYVGACCSLAAWVLSIFTIKLAAKHV